MSDFIKFLLYNRTQACLLYCMKLSKCQIFILELRDFGFDKLSRFRRLAWPKFFHHLYPRGSFLPLTHTHTCALSKWEWRPKECKRVFDRKKKRLWDTLRQKFYFREKNREFTKNEKKEEKKESGIFLTRFEIYKRWWQWAESSKFSFEKKVLFWVVRRVKGIV